MYKTQKFRNIFIAFIFIFSLIYLSIFFIIKNKKSKINQASFIKKIELQNTEIDLATLSPLEKEVLDKFKSIPEKEYSNRYNEIVDSIRVILNTKQGQILGITILKKVIQDKKLSSTDQLYILNKISILETSSGNIVNTIKSTMESIKLAEKIGSKYDILSCKITLAYIFNRLGNYNASNSVLEEIVAEKEIFSKDVFLQVPVYIYFARNYYSLNNLEKSMNFLDKTAEIIKQEPLEYQSNVQVMLDINYAKIFMLTNNEIKVKTFLDSAGLLLKNINNFYFTNLELLYLIELQEYNLKYNLNNFSANLLEKIINDSKEYEDKDFFRNCFNLLFTYYEKTNNFTEYIKLNSKYEMYLEKINHNNNNMFTLYLIESIERNYYSNENEKLYKNIIFLLFIMIFILGIFYKITSYFEIKSKTDALTNLNNRFAFNNTLSSLKNTKYHMLIFDIDNFKNINDTYGHNFGDEVLKKIGKILKIFENQEISIFRIGGEEFAVIFTFFNEDSVVEISEQIRKNIEALNWPHPISVTISGGISNSNQNTFITCDQKLYLAKKSGKNKIIK